MIPVTYPALVRLVQLRRMIAPGVGRRTSPTSWAKAAQRRSQVAGSQHGLRYPADSGLLLVGQERCSFVCLLYRLLYESKGRAPGEGRACGYETGDPIILGLAPGRR